MSPALRRPGTAAEFAGLLGQALFLALLRRPHAALLPVGPAALPLSCLLYLLAGLALDACLLDRDGYFTPEALGARLLPVLLATASGVVLAAAVGRPALWLRLGLLWLLATLPLQLGLLALAWNGHEYLPGLSQWVQLSILIYLALLGLQLLRTARAPRVLAPAAAGLLAIALLLGPVLLLRPVPWWYSWDQDWSEPASEWSITAEGLFYSQQDRLAQRLATIEPQRPSEVDLYLLAFAGDGSERVFRNEVEYAQRLFDQRFGTRGRSLVLANSELDPEAHPIAAMGNLRIALQGLATRMDVEEDVLLLFLTSHGSETHDLLVALDPLPLDQIDPLGLRAALDEAGIRHRVLVVSSCYSGGFIPLLADPDTLIITAAREDRSSFGCGVDSDITWFGQAFLAEALNRETDFADAFERAREAIRQREQEVDFEASHPQMYLGERIAERLARWRDGLQPGPPLAFSPAPPREDQSEAGVESSSTRR